MNKKQTEELLAHARPSREVGIKKLEKPYNQQVIDVLRDLLALAEDGRIDTITCLYREGADCSHAYSGNDNLLEELGSIERIKYIVLKRMDGEI